MAYVSRYVISLVFLVLFLGATLILADNQDFKINHYQNVPYNDNCPDFSQSLGDGCTLNDDCTKLTCTDNSLGNKELTLTIKINKCDDPPTIDVTVDALGFTWTHTFQQSDDRFAIPGLSITPAGKILSAGVYLQVVLQDNGSNLKLKIIILTGVEVFGNFEKITSSTLSDSDLPITTYECGIVRWWNSLSDWLKVLVCGGSFVFVILILVACCCCCGCCRKSSNGSVLAVPPFPATITSTKSNVPMQPFVNEI